LYSIGQNY